VLVKCPVGIANFIMNQKREHVAQIEARYGLSVRVEGDPMLVSPDFTIEKFKTATRVVAEPAAPVVSVDSSLMDQIDEEAEAEEAQEDVATPETEGDEEQKPKKRRRRRRRRKGGERQEGEVSEGETIEGQAEEVSEVAPAAGAQDDASAEAEGDSAEAAGEEEKKPRRRRRSRRKKSDQSVEAVAGADETVADVTSEAPAVEVTAEQAVNQDDAPEGVAASAQGVAAEAEAETTTVTDEAPSEQIDVASAQPADDEAPGEAEVIAESEVAAEESEAVEGAPLEAVDTVAAEAPVAEEVAVVEPAAPPKPKRRGWWSV
jgi:ribonuclease E